MSFTHSTCSITLEGTDSRIENRLGRIEALLRYVSQRFCHHNWIWHFREMECFKCLKRYPIHASFLTATGAYTDAARATARQPKKEIERKQQPIQFKKAKSCG